MKLYFIALVPNSKLKEEIKAFKDELKAKLEVKHALKLPAHITLQIPFKCNEEDEPLLIKTLRAFAKYEKAFEVNLSGFGCFPPRVIFVKVTNHEPVKQIHSKLQQVLEKRIKLLESEKSSQIHPHVTIATRDLSKMKFNRAWYEFKNREYEASFLAHSLFLLKHNGKTWDIFEEFHFQNQNK